MHSQVIILFVQDGLFCVYSGTQREVNEKVVILKSQNWWLKLASRWDISEKNRIRNSKPFLFIFALHINRISNKRSPGIKYLREPRIK